jgi:amidase
VRAVLHGQWFNLFQEVDVVLCQPMPSPLSSTITLRSGAGSLKSMGRKIPYNDLMAWAGIATLNGLPATTMPSGRTENGLPIGVQIVGAYMEDLTTIAFAGLVEREFGGVTPPPV